MKNAVVLLYTCFARLLRNLSPWHTDPACKVQCVIPLRQKDKKKSEPISDLENWVRIILVWCGRWDWILTARRRSVSAALRPHCGLIHYGFFKSHALRFFVSKTKKPSVLSKAFAGAVDETESEPEESASVTCFSMNFTRWSSEEQQVCLSAPYYGENTTNWNL